MASQRSFTSEDAEGLRLALGADSHSSEQVNDGRGRGRHVAFEWADGTVASLIAYYHGDVFWLNLNVPAAARRQGRYTSVVETSGGFFAARGFGTMTASPGDEQAAAILKTRMAWKEREDAPFLLTTPIGD